MIVSDSPDIVLAISQDLIAQSVNPSAEMCDTLFSEILAQVSENAEFDIIDTKQTLIKPLIPDIRTSFEDCSIETKYSSITNLVQSKKNVCSKVFVQKDEELLEIPEEIIALLLNFLNFEKLEPQIENDLNNIILNFKKSDEYFLTETETKSLETIFKDIDLENKNVKNEVKDFVKEFKKENILENKPEIKKQEKPQNLIKETPNNSSQIIFEYKPQNQIQTITNNITHSSEQKTVTHQILTVIKTQINDETSEIEFKLHPKELGVVNVKLQTTESKEVIARFSVQTETVKETINEQIPNLIKQFEEQNIRVSEIQVVLSQKSFDSKEHEKPKQEQEKKRISKISKTNFSFALMKEDDFENLGEDEKVEVEVLMSQGTQVNYRV